MLTSTTKHLEFFVPGIPAPGGSKRAIIHHQKGCPAGRRLQAQRGHCSCRPFSVVVDDAGERNKNWRASVAHAAMEQLRRIDGVMFTGPLEVKMHFYLKRPKHHFGKHGLLPSAPRYPEPKPDILKLARSTEDALTGIVWRDDAANIRLRLEKSYCNSVVTLTGVSINISLMEDFPFIDYPKELL